jgi:hypothetical protein
MGAGIMTLMGFSLSAKINPEVDGNQISFGTVDFKPHPPTLTPVFANLDQEMDLMFGSLNFRISPLGSVRLSNPTKSGPSAEKTTSAVMSDPSIGSPSKVNLSVSFTSTKTTECTIKELNEIMGNVDLEETSNHTDKGSSQNFSKGVAADFTT